MPMTQLLLLSFWNVTRLSLGVLPSKLWLPASHLFVYASFFTSFDFSSILETQADPVFGIFSWSLLVGLDFSMSFYSSIYFWSILLSPCGWWASVPPVQPCELKTYVQVRSVALWSGTTSCRWNPCVKDTLPEWTSRKKNPPKDEKVPGSEKSKDRGLRKNMNNILKNACKHIREKSIGIRESVQEPDTK